MIKKAWMKGEIVHTEAYLKRVRALGTTLNKFGFIPVTVIPTPYFNALRGVARARDYFASALKDAMEYLQTNHETGKLHGCAIEGGKWKQWKQSLTKLTKEENENGKISRC